MYTKSSQNQLQINSNILGHFCKVPVNLSTELSFLSQYTYTWIEQERQLWVYVRCHSDNWSLLVYRILRKHTRSSAYSRIGSTLVFTTIQHLIFIVALYTHTYTHTHARIHTHTHAHTYTRTRVHAYTHTHIHHWRSF